MEQILNSIEELYQLVTGTLPEGYVEHNFRDLPHYERYGTYIHPTGYFYIIHHHVDDRVKIEYGKRYKPIVTDGRIYKYA
jgi:hypothetical protein